MGLGDQSIAPPSVETQTELPGIRRAALLVWPAWRLAHHQVWQRQTPGVSAGAVQLDVQVDGRVDFPFQRLPAREQSIVLSSAILPSPNHIRKDGR